MSYLTDLTSEEFQLIEDLLPQKKVTRPRKYSYSQLPHQLLILTKLQPRISHFIYDIILK